VWARVESGASIGLIAAHAVTTIHYLVEKDGGARRATRIISSILSVLEVAAVDSAVLQEALRLQVNDFEDAVTAAAARNSACDYIVTRDPKGLRAAPVRSLTPEALLPLLVKS